MRCKDKQRTNFKMPYQFFQITAQPCSNFTPFVSDHGNNEGTNNRRIAVFVLIFCRN